MMMPMSGPPPKQTWKDIVEQLETQISNAQKSLLLLIAQLEEAAKHLRDETPEETREK